MKPKAKLILVTAGKFSAACCAAIRRRMGGALAIPIIPGGGYRRFAPPPTLQIPRLALASIPRSLLRGSSLLQLLLFAGCAPYVTEPLTPSHPANAQATIAAIPRRSQTLAYTARDLPVRNGDRIAAADQGAHEGHHGSDTAPAEKIATGEGKIVAVVPSSNQLVIEHGAIKDFMDPMTMGYPTEPASLLQGLKAGDRVRFAIDVNRKVIVKIEKIN